MGRVRGAGRDIMAEEWDPLPRPETSSSLAPARPACRAPLPSDFLLALTGYHADDGFLRGVGVRIDPTTGAPEHDSATFESNVAGLWLAGTMVPGGDYNRVFIENSRFHGERIAAALRRRGQGVDTA